MRKITSKRCWIDGQLRAATITIDQGQIAAIDLGTNTTAQDFGNNIIMPGILDVHVHVNEPGRTEWEGFETITQAAAAGGITSIVDMPLNASPVSTTVEAFKLKLEASKNKMNVNCGFYGGLIPGNSHEIEGLIKAGVLGIKCFLTHSGIDEFPNVTEKDLDIAMPIIAKYNIPLLVHCELEDGFKNNLQEIPGSYSAYLDSRPKKWENDAISMMIHLCKKHQCRVHIVHVSSAEALKDIEQAKADGLPISAETCAQYLLFNAEEIPDNSTIYKCAPPIREKANNGQLKNALKSGILDFITTDHSPAPERLKEIESGSFHKAWGGIAGVQFLLPAAWQSLNSILKLEEFIPLLTENPAKFIHQDKKGKIAIGFDADITIWNPESSIKPTEQGIFFKHKISPYIGKTMLGEVLETIVSGETVFKNNSILKSHQGKWLIQA
ncbi:MAG: allantoinase AllB [Bacteroidia bacterium]